jgi:hypothetical protein
MSHAAIMASYFGTDNITFTLGSDEFAVNPGLGYPANLTRTFTSFSQAAWENAMSRVWLGVHYYWDALDGNILGYNVGNFIFNHQLRPSQLGPCQADMTADTFVDDADFVLFASAYNTLYCTDPAMPPGCPADLNSDTFVDDADFVSFAAAYNDLLCP